MRCGSCCATYPCALAPEDLERIAGFLGMSCTDVFRTYLVLDYAVVPDKKRYYACAARFSDKPGRIVDWDWAFKSSPCIFLRHDACAIEPVKPRGGRTFSCHLEYHTKRNRVIFGKRKAAKAWRGSPLLDQLIAVAET